MQQLALSPYFAKTICRTKRGVEIDAKCLLKGMVDWEEVGLEV